MSDRWLTIELERAPEQPVEPPRQEAAPRPERRPVPIIVPVPPPKRRPLWSVLASALLVVGVLAVLLGAISIAASTADWNDTAAESAEAREGIAALSQAADTALAEELANLESVTSTLGEVSTALEGAAGVAADLEAAAAEGLPPGQAAVAILVNELDRLAAAIDGAFPGLAELGITGPDGPGDALRAAGAAMLEALDPATMDLGTGFGPFVLQYPLPGYSLTDSFGTDRGDGFHGGIDIGAPSGTPILAAADGIVLQAGWLGAEAGNGVILSHDHGWETRYFHMISADLPVAIGDRVLAGQVIGRVGSTGDSTGPHLHFETVFGPIRMDPESWFTYLGREIGIGGPTIDSPSDAPAMEVPAPTGRTSDPAVVPEIEGPTPDMGALPEALAGITDVRRDLRELSERASERALEFTERWGQRQDVDRAAVLALYGGAIAVILGLLLLWVTLPRWPATRVRRGPD